MSTLIRWWAAWLRRREDHRNRAARPGTDNQFAEWLHRETATHRATSKLIDALRGSESVLDELDRQMAALGLHDVTDAATTPLRLVDVLRHAARWRAALLAAKHGCSCSSSRLVVVHDHGTYCGDDQTDLLAAAMSAVDGRGVDNPPLADATYEEKATAALDALRGERR